MELAPCPFCGNSTAPKVVPFDGEPWVPGYCVRCDASGIEGAAGRGCGCGGAWGEDAADAIAAWNRRTSPVEAKPEAEPVEWRYLEHGKGFWKHVYNADNANRLYGENEKLPESRRHFIEPLYPLSAITALQEQVKRLAAERDEAKKHHASALAGLDQEGKNHWAQRDRAEAAEARATSLERELAERFDFLAHLARQREWSERTFGPGDRAKGVVDHIRKELAEIEADPTDLAEWIDVVILALDGAWRAGYSPDQILGQIVAKQAKNEARNWPDWRTMPADKAIEHVRAPDALLSNGEA